MNNQKLFLDTSYIIALASKKDDYYKKAISISYEVEKVKEIWTHEGIILEVADWFAKYDKIFAFNYCNVVLSENTNIKVQKIDTTIIKKSLELYKKYSDKTVGITDCISFYVMWEKNITEALTSDRHFEQVGFKALLID